MVNRIELVRKRKGKKKEIREETEEKGTEWCLFYRTDFALAVTVDGSRICWVAGSGFAGFRSRIRWVKVADLGGVDL